MYLLDSLWLPWHICPGATLLISFKKSWKSSANVFSGFIVFLVLKRNMFFFFFLYSLKNDLSVLGMFYFPIPNSWNGDGVKACSGRVYKQRHWVNTIYFSLSHITHIVLFYQNVPLMFPVNLVVQHSLTLEWNIEKITASHPLCSTAEYIADCFYSSVAICVVGLGYFSCSHGMSNVSKLF